jgi:hypothetical protein
MKFKVRNLFLLLLFSVELAQIKAHTIPSVNKELTEIQRSLVKSQNDVMKEIGQSEPAVELLIESLGKFKGVLGALKEAMIMREYLSALQTISSFTFNPKNKAVSTCNDVIVQVSSISYEMEKCKKVQSDLQFNSEKITESAKKIYRTVMGSKLNPLQIAQSNVEKTLTELDDVAIKMNDFSDVITEKIAKYEELKMALVDFKNENCKCPAEALIDKKQSMKNVDKKITTIKSNVESYESNLRRISLDNSYMLAAFNLEVKKNASLVNLANTLDFFQVFFFKLQNLTTALTFKPTLTCDDTAATVAFITISNDFYYRTDLEAQNNATMVLYYYLTGLKEYYVRNIATMRITTKRSILLTMEKINAFIEECRQYIFSLTSSRIKLDEMMQEALDVRNAGCNCKQISEGYEPSSTTQASKLRKHIKIIHQLNNCLFHSYTSIQDTMFHKGERKSCF